MIYRKPELVRMADARVAIQNGQNDNDSGILHKEVAPVEMGTNSLVQTAGAYEADE